MATIPTSGTNIRLISGVPFTYDGRHTRWFSSRNAQLDYFMSKPVVYTKQEYNYQRADDGRMYIVVDQHKDALWKASYLLFQNTHYNNKWFFAFITDLKYINRSVTHVYFKMDVLQTWMFDIDFKPSFVVREHCKLWNADGTPVINTVEENLDYGSEYDIMDVKRYRPYENLFFLVMVTKSVMHSDAAADNENKIEPVFNGLPQPLSYYIHPFNSDFEIPPVKVGGGENVVMSPILKVLKALFTQDNAVNNVVSLYVTDYMGLNMNMQGETLNLDDTTFQEVTVTDNTGENLHTLYVKNMRDYNEISGDLGDKYLGYRQVKESKLLMYPYTVLIMDDFKGNRVVLKNEYINDKNIKITCRGSLGTSNKVVYHIQNYLTTENVDFAGQMAVSFENAVINLSPNDLPILNDYLSAYLQGNRNSIENQKNQAIFNGIMSTMNAGVAGTQAAAAGQAGGLAGVVVGGVSAIGNAGFQIEGIEAKKQDISNTPPQLGKLGGNTQFDFGNGITGLYIVKKQIKPERIKKLTDFFNMFGYRVHEVKVPNFRTRRYWNHIETKNCHIAGDFNHNDLQEIRNIFDNGITLWHTDDIGNYSLDNGVIG